ncbi:MAG: helix-turn-helix transcriptional regulator [Clostridia bacterium]|nr:helix-turn-helix transcriptional regulator [Clostridia bacterium]
MKLNEAIAKRLSAILESKKITPYAVAQSGGIDKQVVYAVVNCEYKKVSVDTIYQIAATLNMSLQEFFTDPVFKDISD